MNNKRHFFYFYHSIYLFIFFLWDFFFLIQTESHKNYTDPHQFTQSHVINFFFHLDLLLALL